MKPLDASGLLEAPLSGANLIEASAGTGKTQAISTLYVRILIEKRLEVSEILVVTFTRAATAELKTRIRRCLRQAIAQLAACRDGGEAPDRKSEGNGGHSLDEPIPDGGDEPLTSLVTRRCQAGSAARDHRHLTNALRGFDKAAISTIHGFCERMLEEHAFETAMAFDAELVSDESSLLKQVTQDFWAKQLYEAPEVFVRYLQFRGLAPDALMRLAQIATSGPDMEVLPEAQKRALREPLAGWRRAQARAAGIWAAQRTQVLGLLCAPHVLNRRSYHPDKIRRQWAPRMDEVLNDSVPGILDRFEEFAKFTPELLEKGTRRGAIPPRHAFFCACQELADADRALCQVLEQRLLRLQADLVHYARSELRARKDSFNKLSFDDLLHLLRAALEAKGGEVLAERIRTRYKAALIDEFQDTDRVQYDIFRRLYQNTEGVVFLVGDPKQAIYGFRGAELFAYLDAKREMGQRTYTLDTNWRSDPALVRAVNALFAQARAPFVLPQITYRPVESRGDALHGPRALHSRRSPLRVLFVPRTGLAPEGNQSARDGLITRQWAEQHVARLTAFEIARLLASPDDEAARELSPGQIAVLCRYHRQAERVQAALRQLGVPSVRHGAASVLDTEEAIQLERVLRAMREPSSAPAIKAALSTGLMGINGNQLFELQEDEQGWERWQGRFQHWHEIWNKSGLFAAFRCWLEEAQVPRRLLGLAGGERRMTDLLHLAELLNQAAVGARLGPRGLVQWLGRMRLDTAARIQEVGDSAQLRLESDARAVQVVTVHASKGLEYPVVFCPYLWDGTRLRGSDSEWVRFHDRDDQNVLKLDMGSPDRQRHLQWAEQEAMAENLRLLYVALTRAKHWCVVLWGGFAGFSHSALGYLLHQPAPSGPGIDLTAATHNRAVQLSDGEIRDDLQRLATAAQGAVDVRDISLEPAPPYIPQTGDVLELRSREKQRALELNWRGSSFTALVHAGAVRSSPDSSARDGRDLDDGRDWYDGHELRNGLRVHAGRDLHAGLDAYDGRDLGELPAGATGDIHSPPTSDPAAVLLRDFPAGPKTGRLMHAVLEQIDFRTSGHAQLREQVQQALQDFGMASTWSEALCSAMTRVLDTPLLPLEAEEAQASEEAFSLRHIPRAQRLDELEFALPVADTRLAAPAYRPPDEPSIGPRDAPAQRREVPAQRRGAPTQSRDASEQRVSSRLLSDIFVAHAKPPISTRYAPSLAALGFAPLLGYLRGYMDLVFERQGRWYLVDYKSNLLGPRPEDYGPAQLWRTMAEHHYFLQYHLYLVALNRYLCLRLSGYEYERHFGGIFYLFLRGMSPQHPPGCGVFWDRPPKRLVDALSAALEGRGTRA